MVHFNSIIIQDFKSIRFAELKYSKGVWLCLGENNDTAFKSNGAGKSTVLEAIQQCLYNKTLKGTPIEDTYNRITGKGYNITISFTKDSHLYLVSNNRELGKITVTKDNTDISEKGITNNLKLIQSIIGFDFNTFCALTYISHSNIVSLLETFSTSNLMKVLLDFDSIISYEMNIKQLLNKSKERTQFLLQDCVQAEDTLKLLADITYTDLLPLRALKDILNNDFNAKVAEYNTTQYMLDINSLSEELNSLNIELKDANLHKNNVCPTCGSILNTGIDYSIVISEIEDKIHSTKSLIQELSSKLSDAQANIVILKAELDEKLKMIETSISIGEYKNKLYENNKDTIEATRRRLADNKLELSNEYFNQDLYDVILKTIKSGKLHKDLLLNFTNVLNTYIDDYTSHLSISHLLVKSKPLKDNIEFVLYDTNTKQFIELSTLSGGELTRIRLVVLLSMLKTVASLTNMNTNILILDEALDTLDNSASGDLSILFQYLIDTDSKFIALVSHGEQLNEIEFTGNITAVKTNGLTEIIQERL